MGSWQLLGIMLHSLGCAQLIAGLPIMLAWLVLWVVLTSAIMGLIYLLDPENRGPPGGGTERGAAS